MMQYGLFVDLNRCVGCHTCEISCKQENNIPIGVKWVEVVQIGPKEVDGELRMDFAHLINEGCTLCTHRILKNMDPACVVNCPTNALKLGEATEILRQLRDKKRLQLCNVVDIKKE